MIGVVLAACFLAIAMLLVYFAAYVTAHERPTRRDEIIRYLPPKGEP